MSDATLTDTDTVDLEAFPGGVPPGMILGHALDDLTPLLPFDSPGSELPGTALALLAGATETFLRHVLATAGNVDPARLRRARPALAKAARSGPYPGFGWAEGLALASSDAVNLVYARVLDVVPLEPAAAAHYDREQAWLELRLRHGGIFTTTSHARGLAGEADRPHWDSKTYTTPFVFGRIHDTRVWAAGVLDACVTRLRDDLVVANALTPARRGVLGLLGSMDGADRVDWLGA